MGMEEEHGITFEDDALEELERQLAAEARQVAAEAEEVSRHSFRLPCEEEDEAQVRIDGVSYPVINIGSRGVGIALDPDATLHAGQQIPRLELTLRGTVFVAGGQVMHVSVGEETTMLAGIRLDLDAGQEGRIRAMLQQRRESLFAGEAEV